MYAQPISTESPKQLKSLLRKSDELARSDNIVCTYREVTLKINALMEMGRISLRPQFCHVSYNVITDGCYLVHSQNHCVAAWRVGGMWSIFHNQDRIESVLEGDEWMNYPIRGRKTVVLFELNIGVNAVCEEGAETALLDLRARGAEDTENDFAKSLLSEVVQVKRSLRNAGYKTYKNGSHFDCPLCPIRRFSSLRKLAVHVEKTHVASSDFCGFNAHARVARALFNERRIQCWLYGGTATNDYIATSARIFAK